MYEIIFAHYTSCTVHRKIQFVSTLIVLNKLIYNMGGYGLAAHIVLQKSSLSKLKRTKHQIQMKYSSL